MIEYVEMFSFNKCEVYDVVHGYHVTMWPIELLYIVCTYDELNYYMKEWSGWWCGLIDYQVELVVIHVYLWSTNPRDTGAMW